MKAQLPDADIVLHAIRAGCNTPADVHVFDKLDSTNTWLSSRREAMDAQLSEGRAQICTSDWQQAGVGRRGKVWQTLPGNMTFSILSRHFQSARNLTGLSLVTGIAIAEVLEHEFGLDVMLKWPNDVILDHRKLGGLLTEVVTVSADGDARASAATDVISGIGINVQHDDSVVALGIGATSLRAASVELQPSDRDHLVGKICAAVLSAHVVFVEQGWAAFGSTWAKRDWLMGKDVVIHREEATENARACGVNEHGALLVESAGKLLLLYGGNVSIRPTL